MTASKTKDPSKSKLPAAKPSKKKTTPPPDGAAPAGSKKRSSKSPPARSSSKLAAAAPIAFITTAPTTTTSTTSSPPPPPASASQPMPLTLEERVISAEERLRKADDKFQRLYSETFDMSWIYHDSALEGVIYTPQELKMAIDPTSSVVPDSSLQPVCEEIRRHRDALNYIRDLAQKKRQNITVDVIKKMYLILHPDEGDIKSLKYRKDIPQHRLYFHEYAPPDKIAHKVRQVVDWINDPEVKKVRSPIRIAAKAHYELLRVFPFAQDSGKVARMLMNLILLRSGHPAAIIHHTERQRYYEALKGAPAVIVQMVQDAIDNSLASVEKMLDEYETRTRSFVS
jgi:Fic family protein